MSNQPNLFSYATSELSQDAFICWLLAWSDDKYKKAHPKMNEVSRNILAMFFDKSKNEELPEKINIAIKRQHEHIDVLCIINNEYYLIIEDKVGTKQHSKQLERYKKIGADKKQILIYYQTGEQSNYKPVTDSGYAPVSRSDLLKIFESEAGLIAQRKSDILRDYAQRIRSLEDQFSAYITKPAKEWGNRAWQGFFVKLQEKLKQGSWGYVANQSGGFYGFWWNGGKHAYLQIEAVRAEQNLVFKIHVKEKEQRRVKRIEAHKSVTKAFYGTEFRIKKPKRFGNGETMTVALLDGDFRVFNNDGLINIEKTVEALLKIERYLKSYQN